MITVSFRFARSFKIMCIPQPIIPVCAPPQLVTVLRSGSADLIEVPYIRCLNRRVPEDFELWALANDGVCEVHPCARVKLRSKFREDTFQTFFFNSRRFQILFLVCRALKASVEFLDVVCVTQHVGNPVDYNPNIFVNSWVINTTDTIPAGVSTTTLRAYDHICSFHRFVFRYKHKRLRLKRIELKRIRFEELLSRIRQDVSDEVAANVRAPVNDALGDTLSNDYDSDDGWLDRYDSD